MNEPKKSELEAAAARKWPDAIGVRINHRKHTLRVMFGLRSGADIELEARTHRELLEKIKAYSETAAA